MENSDLQWKNSKQFGVSYLQDSNIVVSEFDLK